VVMSDCALEFYEAHPPPMHYHLTVLNAGSHLPDDLSGIGGRVRGSGSGNLDFKG